jgi:hypothetical protein
LFIVYTTERLEPPLGGSVFDGVRFFAVFDGAIFATLTFVLFLVLQPAAFPKACNCFDLRYEVFDGDAVYFDSQDEPVAARERLENNAGHVVDIHFTCPQDGPEMAGMPTRTSMISNQGFDKLLALTMVGRFSGKCCDEELTCREERTRPIGQGLVSLF